MSIKIKIGAVTFLSVIACSCNTRHDSSHKNINSGTVAREIPLDRKGRPDLFYKLAKQKAAQLHLDSLEKGYDSLQIRIWYDYSLYIYRQLVVIRSTNREWSCDVYTMKVDWDDTTRTEKIISNNIDKREPASGWSDFTKQLFDLKLMSLPDISKVPGYDELIGADGASYYVEVATRDKYRFYWYWEPGRFTQFWEARNMEEILRLVEQELNFKRLQKR